MAKKLQLDMFPETNPHADGFQSGNVKVNHELFGEGNDGAAFKRFSAEHVCNKYCRWYYLGVDPSHLGDCGSYFDLIDAHTGDFDFDARCLPPVSSVLTIYHHLQVETPAFQ
jgi:hypothetical protein